jgi:hypothetical protein
MIVLNSCKLMGVDSRTAHHAVSARERESIRSIHTLPAVVMQSRCSRRESLQSVTWEIGLGRSVIRNRAGASTALQW